MLALTLAPNAGAQTSTTDTSEATTTTVADSTTTTVADTTTSTVADTTTTTAPADPAGPTNDQTLAVWSAVGLAMLGLGVITGKALFR